MKIRYSRTFTSNLNEVTTISSEAKLQDEQSSDELFEKLKQFVDRKIKMLVEMEKKEMENKKLEKIMYGSSLQRR